MRINVSVAIIIRSEVFAVPRINAELRKMPETLLKATHLDGMNFESIPEQHVANGS